MAEDVEARIAVLEAEILRLQADLFWKQVDQPEDGCWAWIGYSQHGHGYGQFVSRGRRWLAHRASWTLTFGPIPKGLGVLHHCDNPECVRPTHLFLGDQLVNIADMVRKGRNSNGREHARAVRAGLPTISIGKPGESNPQSKLTAEDVYIIRDPAGSSFQVAPIFGVSSACIRDIRSRRAWRHLPELPWEQTPYYLSGMARLAQQS